MDHRRVPLSAKLNILIVVTILAVSVGLMITGYQAYCRKVDDFLYARCEDAAGAASQSGGELAEDLWHAINTEEFRSVRARAIEKNDFADAGHEKLLLRRDGRWEFLPKEVSGIPLGVFTDDPDGSGLFPEQTLTLQCGDVLLQYTDGVTEAKHEKQRFGEAGLLSAAAGAPSAKPDQLLPFIRRQIDLFAGQEPQFDDITMMGLQYLGPSEQ